jgi:hypothetical protein
MNDEDFQKLLLSVKQVGTIMQGGKLVHRRTTLSDGLSDGFADEFVHAADRVAARRSNHAETRDSFPPQAETGIPAIMAQGHDPHSVGFFVKEQVVRKSLKIRTAPTARVEVEAFGM